MELDFQATQECMRCSGKGYLFIKTGLPGQDPRDLPNGVADVVWGSPVLVWCVPCNATGRRALRDRPQTEPRYRHWNTDFQPTNRKLNYLGD